MKMWTAGELADKLREFPADAAIEIILRRPSGSSFPFCLEFEVCMSHGYKPHVGIVGTDESATPKR